MSWRGGERAGEKGHHADDDDDDDDGDDDVDDDEDLVGQQYPSIFGKVAVVLGG